MSYDMFDYKHDMHVHVQSVATSINQSINLIAHNQPAQNDNKT